MATGPRRLLAIDVHAVYVGFAVIEAPFRLIDWGLLQFNGEGQAAYGRAAIQAPRAVARYRPDAIVITMPANQKLARERIARVREAFITAAGRARVPAFEIARAEYLGALEVRTRYSAAVEMASRYPALAPRLRKPRKIWESERPYMAVFDAVAAGTAYFLLKRRRRAA